MGMPFDDIHWWKGAYHILSSCYHILPYGVSINEGTPKWMVYFNLFHGKSYSNGWFGGTLKGGEGAPVTSPRQPGAEVQGQVGIFATATAPLAEKLVSPAIVDLSDVMLQHRGSQKNNSTSSCCNFVGQSWDDARLWQGKIPTLKEQIDNHL